MKLLKTFWLALSLSLLACQPCQAQTQEDYDWVKKYYPDVLRKILPVDEGTGWRVGFTINRDLYTEVLEYSCIFEGSWPESPETELTVVVRAANAKSLSDQMMALRLENPAASIEQMRSRLKIKEWRLSDKSCPAARELYNAFYNLNLPMLSAKDRADFAKGSITITEHPLIYNIRAVTSGGNLELLLAGQEHPFVRWADRTRSQLDACIRKNEKQIKR